MTVSLVTNACPGDAARLRVVVPHWQRTFGDRFNELVVVLDRSPPSGRIAALHGPVSESALEELEDVLADFVRGDGRIRVDALDDDKLDVTAARWFRKHRPIRCQSGTPILAFARAFDAAGDDRVVLRADCDMIFFEGGWLDEAVNRLEEGSVELLEPSRLCELPDPKHPLSTRALLLDRRRFYAQCLPMRAHRTDALRRLKRRLQGRPRWLALEQMLSLEVKAGRVRHSVLPDSLGWSMHIATRAQATFSSIPEVVAAFEMGEVPTAQFAAGWNFEPMAWEASESESVMRPNRNGDGRRVVNHVDSARAVRRTNVTDQQR